MYGVASLSMIWMSSPVRVSNVRSLTMPNLFPSFVTTSRPIISLDGFFSKGMSAKRRGDI